MPIRFLTILSVFALVFAACAGGGAEETSTTSQPVEATTTVAPTPEAMLLSYSLEPGSTLTYEVDMDQSIVMSVDGDASALGDGEEIPAEMDLSIAGSTTFTHEVAEGPEPGTYAITITGDLSDLQVTGTMDDEPVSRGDIPDLAGMEPVEVTIVVDEKGNVIPDESNLGEGLDFFGGLGGFDMLENMGPGAGGSAGQFIGPPFTEEEVTVGDSWSETVEIPTLPGDDPILTHIDSEVVGTDVIDGAGVLVIETTTATSAIEFDLAEILIGFMTAFLPEDATPEEQAEMDAMVEQLRFAFSIDPTASEMTTWFDFEAGLSRQADFLNTTHLIMDIKVPDEDTGDLVEMALDMTVAQDITYRLLDAGSA